MSAECSYIYLEGSSSSNWWYSAFRSILLKTEALFKSWISSSTVGSKCLSLIMALLASRMSTYKRISSGFFLGGVTMGDTQGVGVFPIFSIMFWSSSFWISFFTLGLRWKAVFLFLCATGLTLLSLCNIVLSNFITEHIRISQFSSLYIDRLDDFNQSKLWCSRIANQSTVQTSSSQWHVSLLVVSLWISFTPLSFVCCLLVYLFCLLRHTLAKWFCLWHALQVLPFAGHGPFLWGNCPPQFLHCVCLVKRLG